MLIALPNAFGDAATNMAIDAALLAHMPVGLAAFRHYGWQGPAATFGYTQQYHRVVTELASGHAPIEPAQASTTLTRRMTGGGIVDHRNDWTYALILHSSVSAASTPATDLYAQIHQAISLSLDKIGIDSRLAPCPRPAKRPPSPVRYPLAALSAPQPTTCFAPMAKKSLEPP